MKGFEDSKNALVITLYQHVLLQGLGSDKGPSIETLIKSAHLLNFQLFIAMMKINEIKVTWCNIDVSKLCTEYF